MENKLSFRTMRLVFCSEYVRWITDPRLVIVGVFLIFLRSYLIPPIQELAADMNGTISMLEPFVAIGNSTLLLLFVPLLFLVLISDYPHLDGSSRYAVYRCGKKNWILGQFLFLIAAILTYLSVILVASCLFSKGSFLLNWSKSIREFLSVYPEKKLSMGSLLLPSNLYNQVDLLQAIFYTLLMQGLYMLMLALLVYVMKLYQRPAVGIILAIIMIIAGTAGTLSAMKWMWFFPTAHTLLAFHFDSILRVQVFPIWASWVYMVGVTVLLLGWNIRAGRQMQFW